METILLIIWLVVGILATPIVLMMTLAAAIMMMGGDR